MHDWIIKGSGVGMAPEVRSAPKRLRGVKAIHGEIRSEYDPKKSDVWSFGFLLFEVVTLAREPRCRAAIGEFEEAVATPIKLQDLDFRDSGVAFDSDLVRLIQSCLAWMPSERPTAEEVCDNLERLLGFYVDPQLEDSE